MKPDTICNYNKDIIFVEKDNNDNRINDSNNNASTVSFMIIGYCYNILLMISLFYLLFLKSIF